MGFTDRDGSLQSLLSSTRLPVSLFVYPPVSLSVRLSGCQSLFVYPPASLSAHLPACQSLCPSTRLPISLPIYPPASLSVRLPACQSLCPSTRLPISLSVYRLSVCIVSVFLSRIVCLHVYLSVRQILSIVVHCYRESTCSESKCCFLLFSPTSFMQPSCR